MPGYNTFFMEPGRRAQYSGFDPRLPVGGNPSPLTSHMVAAPGQSSNFFSLPSGFGPMIEVKGTKTLLVPRQGVNSKWLDELQDLLLRTRCGEIVRQQER